jgi:hypothetical protein
MDAGGDRLRGENVGRYFNHCIIKHPFSEVEEKGQVRIDELTNTLEVRLVEEAS